MQGDAREKLAARLADRLSREILGRQTILDCGAVFSQILIVVVFNRHNGTIKDVKFSYKDDGDGEN